MKKLFVFILTAVSFIHVNAQWTTSVNDIYSSNSGKVGVGTATPLSKLTVKSTNLSTYGILSVQDASGYGSTGQAFVSFFGSDNNRLSYFGPSYGNFMIQNDQSNVVVVSPGSSGRLIVGGFTNYNKNFQVHGDSYLQGNVGIGTASPNAKLEAAGAIFSSGLEHDAGIYISGENGDYGSIQGTDAYNSTTKNLVLQEYGGDVAIGTTNTHGYKFAVNGDALFTKIKVKTYSAWPDYVFHKSYNLPTLKEVEQYIKKHQHLPNVPSANEVEKNGLDIADNQAMLLRKIEELTLYVIELDKKLEKQKAISYEQQKIIKRLKFKSE